MSVLTSIIVRLSRRSFDFGMIIQAILPVQRDVWPVGWLLFIMETSIIKWAG